jgi:hypothetical protein
VAKFKAIVMSTVFLVCTRAINRYKFRVVGLKCMTNRFVLGKHKRLRFNSLICRVQNRVVELLRLRTPWIEK